MGCAKMRENQCLSREKQPLDTVLSWLSLSLFLSLSVCVCVSLSLSFGFSGSLSDQRLSADPTPEAFK